jgi:hypothetical protein
VRPQSERLHFHACYLKGQAVQSKINLKTIGSRKMSPGSTVAEGLQAVGSGAALSTVSNMIAVILVPNESATGISSGRARFSVPLILSAN